MKKKLALLALVSLAAPFFADTYKYDFATDKAPLREGFVRVSAASSEDASWSGGDGKALYHEFSYDSVKDRYGRTAPPDCYPIDLSAGKLTGAQSARLTFPKVRAGRYHLWALSGNAGGKDTAMVWDTTLAVGKDSGRLTFSGVAEIMDMDFEVEAGEKGLELDLSTRSRWLLNALVLIPVQEWDVQRKGWLKELRDDLFILPRAVRDKWTYRVVPSDVPEPKWTDAQKKEGFAIYTRPCVEPIYPDHFPRLHELDAPVRAFAALNERETLNFAIYPLRDFSRVKLEVTALKGPGGFVIGKDFIDLRYVRYMYVRPNYKVQGTYYRVPDVVMPWSDRELVKGENLRVWLDVEVPKGAVPGFYKGEALLDLDGAKKSVPLTFRVLPIQLLCDESLVFGEYYHHPYDAMRNSDPFSCQWWEHKAHAEHAFMRDMGVNSLVLGSPSIYEKDGRISINFDRYQRKIDLYRLYGFTKPVTCGVNFSYFYKKYTKKGTGPHCTNIVMPPQAFFDDITEVTRLIVEEAQRRQWPQLLFYPVDEPSEQPQTVELMRRLMAAIKKVPGAVTYVTADPAKPGYAPLKPVIDVWCCQPFSLPREQVLADMKANPLLQYWSYPNHVSGENDHTLTIGGRMTYGFGFWNSGFRALIPWIYQYISSSQWNYLDGSCSDFMNRTDMDGNPIPVALWYSFREGYDDGRYINTLEKTIERAAKAGFSKQAEEARADLELLRNSIVLQPKYKDKDLWSPETYDVYRWLLATHIMKLQQLF